MTTKHVVADAVLGKIARRFWELLRRILEGSVDANRALFFLQRGIEGYREDFARGGSNYGIYILESRWSWDSSHREFATIALERCDSKIPFEELLDPNISKEKKQSLFRTLKRIFDAQIPRHGGYKMLRLYRVMGKDFHGYSPGFGFDGTLESEVVDLTFVLKPLFDFDEDKNPIPCQIQTS